MKTNFLVAIIVAFILISGYFAVERAEAGFVTDNMPEETEYEC